MSDEAKFEYLCFVFYLHEPLTITARGKQFGQLARAILDVVAPPAADLTIWPDAGAWPQHSPWKHTKEGVPHIEAKRVSRANSAGLDVLLSLPAEAGNILLLADRRGAKLKAVDFWWSLSYERSERLDRFHVDTRITAEFNTSLFKEAGFTELMVQKPQDPAARRLVDALVAVMAEHSDAYSGHVEVVRNDEIWAGSYYSNVQIRPLPVHRDVNHAVWWSPQTDRGRMVRAAHWGNFLGPTLAQRFDPDGQTTRRFLEHHFDDDERIPSEQYATRFPSGALFLAASGNPLDMSQREGGGVSGICIDNIAWLHRAFRDRGMLA